MDFKGAWLNQIKFLSLLLLVMTSKHEKLTVKLLLYMKAIAKLYPVHRRSLVVMYFLLAELFGRCK